MLYLLLLKGIIHESTLTAIISISCGAVDQILFTKRNELSCFLEVLSFQWSGSTKRPARTALAWEDWQRVQSALGQKCDDENKNDKEELHKEELDEEEEEVDEREEAKSKQE